MKKSKPKATVNKAASALGKRSAQVRQEQWGKKEFAKKMREWGKLGGRPRKTGTNKRKETK